MHENEYTRPRRRPSETLAALFLSTITFPRRSVVHIKKKGQGGGAAAGGEGSLSGAASAPDRQVCFVLIVVLIVSRLLGCEFSPKRFLLSSWKRGYKNFLELWVRPILFDAHVYKLRCIICWLCVKDSPVGRWVLSCLCVHWAAQSAVGFHASQHALVRGAMTASPMRGRVRRGGRF